MLLRRHYEIPDELEADVAEEETSLTPVTEDELPVEAPEEEAEPEEAEPEEVSDGDAGTRKGKA
ncbi:hypothetical protein [Oribacterium sp. oral taxon 078]|uniref:hypothetical protein n=1 Tax=Oribacterium sp. oral taxon 078 TaxID=652706 RepID=UPI0012DBDB34|nr:hypothetical protein [Oribacterium sp. oral taxon 078]